MGENTLFAGRYELGRLLGRGGMGEVYQARDRASDRDVALKVMRPKGIPESTEIDREWEVRFEREVRAIRALDSPHVIQVVDSGIDPSSDERYIAMELLDGEDLSALLRRVIPVPVDVALRIGAQACLGLERAHAAGVVHRDIKPGNLFLANEADGFKSLRILDFGIARMGSSDGDGDLTELTKTGSMLGSPQYMSPEQARGSKGVDPRADLWSLGVVLYRLMCGALPHEQGKGGLGEMLIAICCVPAPLLQKRAPWVGPGPTAVVHRALSIDRNDRFSSAREMYEEIVALLPNGDTSIHESMIVPVTSNDRAFVAKRVQLPSITTTEPHVQSPLILLPDPAASSPRRTARRTSAAWPIALGVAATLGLLGVGAAVVVRDRQAAAQPPPPITPAPPQQSAPAPKETAEVEASLSVPKGATVEVDGEVVVVEGTQLTLRGPPGTTRMVTVKVPAEGREMRGMVAITPAGAIPSAMVPPPSAKSPPKSPTP